MEKLRPELEKMLEERYGKDSIVALATMKDGIPCVRYVNGLYIDGAYYIITYGLSDKMKQIEENAEIAGKLREAFAEWIDNGHNNFEDVNTCILCVRLTDGILLSQGTRYEIDFRG